MPRKPRVEQNGTDPTQNLADRAILILIIVTLAVLSVHLIAAYDLWWQLRTGQLVRASGWPTTDPFSYGFPERPWIELRWLYCVVISVLYEKGGPILLIAANTLWIATAGTLLWLFGRGEKRWLVNLALLSALVLAHSRFVVRPEVVTYFLLAAFLLLVRRYQLDGKRHWLIGLPLLQVIWVNSHTLYALGPIILWVFVAAEAAGRYLPWISESTDLMPWERLKWLAGAAAAVTLACLLNPYGLHGALFAVQLFAEIQSDDVLNGLITELHSPFRYAGVTFQFVSYITIIAVSAFGFILRRRAIAAGWLAVWGAFLYLSLMAQRNLALFGIAAAVSIIVNYRPHASRTAFAWAARTACAVVTLALIPAAVSNYYYRSIDPDTKFGFGIAHRRFPIRAMEFVEREQLPLPALTGLAESSYLLFKLPPPNVYIDGRLEVYGPENVVSAIRMLASGDGLTATAERLNVWTLIAHIENDRMLVQRLLGDAAWTAVYFDDSHIVFVRNGSTTQQFADRLKIDWQHPDPVAVDLPDGFIADGPLTRFFPSVGDSGPSRSLAGLYIMAGNMQLAQSSLEEAVRQWPSDPGPNFQLAVLYRAQKREAEAARLFARVPSDISDQLNNQIAAAQIYESYGNMQAAADAWLQVTRLGDQSTAVYEHLAQAAVSGERWDAAYVALTALSKSSPNDIDLLNNIGLVAEKLNRKKEAQDALERSLALQPGQPQTATRVGLLRLAAGDIEGGRRAFEQALAADPSFEPAQRYLEQLRKRTQR